MKPFRTGNAPRTIAHRGGSGIRPENTLEAFRHAYALGVRTFELDVHLSRDGVLVVHHDDTVDRTTNGTGPLDGKTLADLRSLDAGYRFTDAAGTTPYRGLGIRIPTLAEVVDAFPDVHVIIELKPVGLPIARAIRVFLDDHGVVDRLCIAGFDEPTLALFRDLPGPRAITSAGSSAIIRFFVASRLRLERLSPPPCQMLQVPPVRYGLRVIDPRFVDAAHRLGIEVHAWTIDDPDEMRELLALGVDAVITDRPDLAVALEARG